MICTVTIHRDGPICWVPLPFDPKEVWGKTRYAYRSTVAAMGGPSSSHQSEHVEAVETAKKSETRARRIAAAVEKLR